jgi:DME family drug/metabolite transporter
MRLVVGSIALTSLALVRGNRPHLRRDRWPLATVVLAGGATAMYQLAFFAGVRLTGVAVGTVVTIGSAPIFAALLGYFVAGERLTRRWFLATALSLTGVALLALAGDETRTANPLGMTLALGAGLAYAVFTLSNKRLVAAYPPDAVMAVAFTIGALLLLPVLFLVPMGWLRESRGFLAVMHLGLVATGASYALFGRGLKATPVAVAATLSLAEPLTATLLGVLVVGEALTLYAAAGMTLILLGLFIMTRRSGRPTS